MRVGRPSRRSVLSAIITLGFVVTVAIVFWQRRDEVRALFEDPGPELALIGALVVVAHFLNSAEFWVLYRAQGVRIGLWETWMLFLANQLGNLAPGQVGSVYRFRYLKVVHGLSYAGSGSNFAANLVVSLGSSALVGLAGLALHAAGGRSVSWLLVLAVIGVGAAFFALLVIPLPAVRTERSIGDVWHRFRLGWHDVRENRSAVGQVLALDSIKYLIVAIRFDVAFGLLGVDEALSYFLVIAPAAGLAGAIAFTPGGLGIREAAITAAAVGMGSSFDAGLLAATVDRGVMLVTSGVLGSAGMWWTQRTLRLASAAADEPIASDGFPVRPDGRRRPRRGA